MYNNKRNNRGFKPFRGQRNFRRIKTFDPTNIVNTPVTPKVEPLYVIKNKFSDFAISNHLKENISKKGYLDPTPIQDQAIPAILSGRDVIGMANTGTGKTAAFLIPLIEKVTSKGNQKVLILAPTRELARQIRTELMSYSYGLNIYSVLVVGGESMWRQKDALRRNPNFVIGTPGRLEDMVKTRNIDLSQYNSVVLDEADQMVDFGFIESIKRMISLLPKVRQSLFFSATVNDKIKQIIQGFVVNPITISVKSQDASANVKQEIVKIYPPSTKIVELEKILKKEESKKILIFSRTKHGAQKLSEDLVKRGFRSDAIHGNKNQNQRNRTLDKFRNDLIQILVATDVASRGLDIANVSHVVNFDLPESYESYIHRIGRTGRSGKTGIALTFVE